VQLGGGAAQADVAHLADEAGVEMLGAQEVEGDPCYPDLASVPGSLAGAPAPTLPPQLPPQGPLPGQLAGRPMPNPAQTTPYSQAELLRRMFAPGATQAGL